MKKWLAVLLVLLLYAVPFYQEYWCDPRQKWTNLRITDPFPLQAASGDPPYFAEQFVNPAQPGVACHVSSIAAAGKDKLICTWYAGSREGALDVAIYAAFFHQGAGIWTEPRVLVNPRQSSHELRRWVRK
ncbi:MAG: exo-alpha-sialidase, partial [Desulfobaccales bacterium]